MRRALPLLCLPFLAGCPYLFGPPDLAEVDSGTPPDPDTTGTTTGTSGTTAGTTGTTTGTSGTTGTTTGTTGTTTGTTGTTGTTTGTSGTTGTTTGVVDPVPRVTNLVARFQFSEVHLEFVLEDDDNDLFGGDVTTDDGTSTNVFLIPGDLTPWVSGGTSAVVLDVGLPCAGISETWTVTATDAAGNTSLPAYASLTVAGFDHDEANDPTDAGVLTFPAIVCGTLGNSNDVDEVTFEAGSSGTWNFALSDQQATPKDRDLDLLDDVGAVIATAATPYDPDVLQATTTAGTVYGLQVYTNDSGGGSPWAIAVYE